jgi:hypothetical protein
MVQGEGCMTARPERFAQDTFSSESLDASGDEVGQPKRRNRKPNQNSIGEEKWFVLRKTVQSGR